MLLAFLIFVVLLSGLVAYSADTIARKAGRKHMRLFGLRPKTTALIVAVVSGMGISLASVLAFGLINRAAISNITQADKLRIELAQLKKDVKATAADLALAQQERDAANARVQASRQETAGALADLKSAETKLKTTQAARTKLAGEVSALQTRIEQLNTLKSDLEARAARNRRALSESQQALEGSRKREQDQAARLSLLGTQIVELDSRSVQAQQDARAAQARAETLQIQIQRLETSRATVQTQLVAAQQSRDSAVKERERAAAQRLSAVKERDSARKERDALQKDRQNALNNRDAAIAERNAAIRLRDQANSALSDANKRRDQALKARDSAVQARDLAQAQRESLADERDRLVAQRSDLMAQRDTAAQDLGEVRRELQTTQTMLGTLENQRQSLSAANDTLKASLSSAQANLSKLEVDYSRTNSELSANRNTDLIYSRNDLVYAGVVASVRNVPDFLKAVSAAAQKQGARGTPAARLSPDARALLENKLRGLNTNTFVQCRASVNVANGFPVDLSCDARPQTVLFRRGQVIRQTRIDLQLGTDNLSAQLTDLIRDTVFDLTAKGVPLEYITDLGLSDSERLDILGRLGAQSGASAVVGLAPRDDVRPGTQVDLYPVLK